MTISQTPKFSQMQGGKQIAKPLRSIETSGVRMQSRMRAYKDLKAGLSTKMSATKARGLALDMVVGAHERGSTKDKVKVMTELAAEGKLSSKFKSGSTYQLRKAVNTYEKAVDAFAPKEKPKIENEDFKRARLRQAELQNKMRADHDARIKGNQGTGISGQVGGLGGREENVTTSISRVSNNKKSEPEAPIIPLE